MNVCTCVYVCVYMYMCNCVCIPESAEVCQCVLAQAGKRW
jgi:hypothetical protein